jgi:hypothetical protein
MGVKSTVELTRDQAMAAILELLDGASDEALGSCLDTLNEYDPEMPYGLHNFRVGPIEDPE